jgi:hypothetical protein
MLTRRSGRTARGPFGEETPGPWQSVEAVFSAYRRILRAQRWFGGIGRFGPASKRSGATSLRRGFETAFGMVGWYGIHARQLPGSPHRCDVIRHSRARGARHRIGPNIAGVVSSPRDTLDHPADPNDL